MLTRVFTYRGFRTKNLEESRMPFSSPNDPRLQWLKEFPSYLTAWKASTKNFSFLEDVVEVDRKKMYLSPGAEEESAVACLSMNRIVKTTLD